MDGAGSIPRSSVVRCVQCPKPCSKIINAQLRGFAATPELNVLARLPRQGHDSNRFSMDRNTLESTVQVVAQHRGASKSRGSSRPD
jgi:hypothetical protein